MPAETPTLNDLADRIDRLSRLSALLLKRADAAAVLGMGVTSFKRALAAGRVPRPVRTPAGVRWRRADLEKYVGRLTAGRAKRSEVPL